MQALLLNLHVISLVPLRWTCCQHNEAPTYDYLMRRGCSRMSASPLAM